jgi:hypothetical protein
LTRKPRKHRLPCAISIVRRTIGLHVELRKH